MARRGKGKAVRPKQLQVTDALREMAPHLGRDAYLQALGEEPRTPRVPPEHAYIPEGGSGFKVDPVYKIVDGRVVEMTDDELRRSIPEGHSYDPRDSGSEVKKRKRGMRIMTYSYPNPDLGSYGRSR